MTTRTSRHVGSGVRLLLLAGFAAMTSCRDGVAGLPYYRSATMTPEWLSDREANSSDTHRIAAFRLTDQSGMSVSNRALEGKVTIVGFFFTHCGDVCPTTTRNLARVLRELPDQSDVQVLSHSVTPDRDSVAALRSFADSHGIRDPRWHLLTGPVDEITRLARDSYFVRLGSDSTYGVASIAHTESVLLVDGCGRLRGVYAGTLTLEMQRLQEDVVTLARANCSVANLSKS